VYQYQPYTYSGPGYGFSPYYGYGYYYGGPYWGGFYGPYWWYY